MKILELADTKHSVNIGDASGRPSLYFPINPVWGGMYAPITESNCHLLIGGGGLANKHEDRVRKMKVDGKRIAWGLGSHLYPIRPDAAIRGFDLVGIRDCDYDGLWVPCVSCMSELFDREYPIQQDFVFYENVGARMEIGEQPMKSNSCTTMQESVEYLASAECVVTNSYHGAYWASLMGRKVVAIPRGHKFHTMKHPVELRTIHDWRDGVKFARVYPEMLQECREANLDFYRRFQCLIHLFC